MKMVDYSNGVFGGGNPSFGVDSSLELQGGTAPQPTGFDWKGAFSNPAYQTAALYLAKALDPNGFGGRLAEGALQMRQAASTAKGNAMATQGGGGTNAPAPTQNAGSPSGTPQLSPEQEAIMGKAKGLNSLGSFLKKGYEIDPRLMPSSYMDDLRKALSANPTIENPTQPGSSSVGQQLSGVQPVQQFELPPELAMSMTPEQVQNVFQHKLSVQQAGDRTRTQNLAELMAPSELASREADIAFRRFQMDPQRHAEQLELAREPYRQQIEVYKQKNAMDMQSADEFIAKFPSLAGVQLAGGSTVGDMVRMAALNGNPGATVATLINAGLDYKIAVERANAERERTALLKQDTSTQKNLILYEKTLKDMAQYSNDKTPEEWAKLPPRSRQILEMNGGKPRTEERQAALDSMKALKRNLEVQLFPETADALHTAEDKLEGAGSAASKLHVDQNKLDKVTRRTLGKPMWNFDVRSMFDYSMPSFSGVDPNLLNAVISVESSGNPKAVSPKGAAGLMQLMPGTAKDMGVTNRFDSKQNVQGGAKYLKQLSLRYKGDIRKALAAYNWGMDNVDKYGYEGAPASVKAYVNKVLQKYSGT
jgi:hypothetical protein